MEYETAPFPVALDQRMELNLLPVEDQAGYVIADVLPASVISMDLLELRWPKSDNIAVVAVAQSSGGLGAEQQLLSHVAVLVPGHEPVALNLDQFSASGFVARLCVWPTEPSARAELILLFAFSWGWQDSSVLAFRLAPDGGVTPVDTTGANTLFGWFEAVDLDGDGTFELVTSRNLDGTIGGFFYHAVRAYDPVSSSYTPQPERYRDYFAGELAWLDWVISTRAAIQADPEPYMGNTGVGPVYRAEYQGIVYGFDSIVEVPSLPGDELRLDDYNAQRREAFDLVREYRDDLKQWLSGGEYPAAWRLSP